MSSIIPLDDTVYGSLDDSLRISSPSLRTYANECVITPTTARIITEGETSPAECSTKSQPPCSYVSEIYDKLILLFTRPHNCLISYPQTFTAFEDCEFTKPRKTFEPPKDGWLPKHWYVLYCWCYPHQQKTGTDKSPTMRVGVPLWNVWPIVRIVTLFAEITRLKTRRHVRMRKDRRRRKCVQLGRVKTVWVPFVIWGRAESLTRLSFTHEDTFGIN